MKYNKVKKHKHLSFEDRCTIEEYLNYGYNFTQIANRLGKDRTTISNEVRKHRFLRGKLNSHKSCCYESKPPYVCNNCDKKTFCKKTKYTYNHAVAYNEYKQGLVNSRKQVFITKDQIASINFIGNQNLDKLKIDKINYDDIDLTIRLLKK